MKISLFAVRRTSIGLTVVSVGLSAWAVAAEVTPDQLEFRRQGVRRMIFDRSQDISLAGLWPAKVIGLDVMHPAVNEQENGPRLTIEGGRLRIRAKESATATRWIGGFNPFAIYDVAVNTFTGSGEIGVMFRDTDAEDRITVTLVVEGGVHRGIRCVVVKDGKEAESQDFALPDDLVGSGPIRLRVQMLAVGANVFVEVAGRSTLIGHIDIAEHFDLRRKDLMRRFEFCLHSSLQAGASVEIDEATAALSPGCGQADIRAITYKDGSPFMDQGRLWFTITLRGRHGGWPMQGVFSMNPSVFDIRFEGLIVFDRDDGLLRNELASHLFYDKEAQEWRGMTVGFSAAGDPVKDVPKQLWAVTSKRDPRFGFSVMKAKPVEMPGSSEDPSILFDQEAQKWRVLVCTRNKGFLAALYEADEWDGPYVRIAGPVTVDSTGCLLQKFGSKYYALFGSADRKVYIYSYPDLKPAGELRIHRPPWGEKTNTRVWPNVISLPEGYPAPYIALMMDRLNFPGMPTPSWTYGAMYLYHGHPINED